MPQKRRRKGDPRNEAEDFQIMDIDFNPPPSESIATSSSLINISQWHIDGGRVHATSAITSIDIPTAPSVSDSTTQAMFTSIEVPTVPLVTDSTTQAMFDNFDYNVEVETFDNAESDPSAKKRVSHFRLITSPAVLNHVLFDFLGYPDTDMA